MWKWEMFAQSKELLVTSLKFPEDVVMGEMMLSFAGHRALLVENYRAIVLYTDELIKLQGKTCRLCVSGSRLSIQYYTKEEMKITGQIKSVQFE